jgi:hypothetical protein
MTQGGRYVLQALRPYNLGPVHDAISAVISNIALSLPVKTLTLPAIETAEGAEAS